MSVNVMCFTACCKLSHYYQSVESGVLPPCSQSFGSGLSNNPGAPSEPCTLYFIIIGRMQTTSEPYIITFVHHTVGLPNASIVLAVHKRLHVPFSFTLTFRHSDRLHLFEDAIIHSSLLVFIDVNQPAVLQFAVACSSRKEAS